MGNNCFKGKAEESFERNSQGKNANKQIQSSTSGKGKKKNGQSPNAQRAGHNDEPVKNPFKKKRGEGFISNSQR